MFIEKQHEWFDKGKKFKTEAAFHGFPFANSLPAPAGPPQSLGHCFPFKASMAAGEPTYYRFTDC